MKEAHDHHRVTPEGKLLGQQMAKLYAIAEKRLHCSAEVIPRTHLTELTERCRTCAFRAGTVPNGCAQTQLDISKCVSEGIPFYCHQHQGQLCRGWVVTRAGLGDRLREISHLTMDVPLSPPDSQRHIVVAAEAKRERRAEKRRQLAARQAMKGVA